MEQKFSNNSLDLETLREYCKREREAVIYRKGDQLDAKSVATSRLRVGNSQYEIRFGDFKQFS